MSETTPSSDELARRLTHAARYAAVGKVAAGAAHEINQPLNVIRMAAFNIRRAIQKGTLNPESALEKLEKIDTQISRAARLVGGMKAFSPTSSALKTAVKPSESIEVALELLAKRFSVAGVELVHEALDLPCEMQADPTSMQELVINLVDNAIEAYGPAPAPQMNADADEQPPRTLEVKESLTGTTFTLEIVDHAGGIPDAIRGHVLEPFFTTHDDGMHPGLGLTVCQSVVADLNGTLEIVPTADGTAVTVTLPVEELPESPA